MALHVVSTKQALVDLANEMNNKSFTLDKISVGEPRSDTTVVDTNTVAKFSAIKGKGYRGDVDIHYIRLNTVEAFGITNYRYQLLSTENIDSEAIFSEVVSKLELDWNLPLTKPGELGGHTYTQTGTEFDEVVGVIRVDLSPNYVLRGELTILLINPKIPLPDVIVITRLDGFKEDEFEMEDNG